jgi:hypothetical protein
MRVHALRHLFAATASTLLLLAPAFAQAQIFRAYLAIDGSDANPCTLPAPCRLLPAALNAIVDGGEIWMLDSANYNTTTVTVGKSVSILAVPGSVGSILAIGGPAINIIADSLKVSLRNVVIAPLPSGGATVGVRMVGASALTIEDSLIANLPNHGVYVSGGGKLRIANSTVRDNGDWGVNVQNGAQAQIFGAQLLGNSGGGVLSYAAVDATFTRVSVSDSAISGGPNGVRAYAALSGATAKAFVTRCTIAGNSHALRSDTTGVGIAMLGVSDTMVVQNDYGWYQDGAGSVIWSLGNNHIMQNGATFGSLTPAAPQ